MSRAGKRTPRAGSGGRVGATEPAASAGEAAADLAAAALARGAAGDALARGTEVSDARSPEPVAEAGTNGVASAGGRGRSSVACAAGAHSRVDGGLCELDRGTFPHACLACGRFCHAICGTHAAGEEGSGSRLTCFSCQLASAAAQAGAADHSAPCDTATPRDPEAPGALGVEDPAGSRDDDGKRVPGDSAQGGVPSEWKQYARYDAHTTALLLQECLNRDIPNAGHGRMGPARQSVVRELNKAMAAAKLPGRANWHARGRRRATQAQSGALLPVPGGSRACGRPPQTSAQSARRRYHLLMRSFRSNDRSATWRSGTSEEFREVERLLAELAQLEDEAKAQASQAKGRVHRRARETAAVHRLYAERHHAAQGHVGVRGGGGGGGGHRATPACAMPRITRAAARRRMPATAGTRCDGGRSELGAACTPRQQRLILLRGARTSSASALQRLVLGWCRARRPAHRRQCSWIRAQSCSRGVDRRPRARSPHSSLENPRAGASLPCSRRRHGTANPLEPIREMVGTLNSTMSQVGAGMFQYFWMTASSRWRSAARGRKRTD